MATGVYSAGTAFLSVVPSFAGVEGAMADELRKMGAKLDAQMQASGTNGLRNAGRNATASGRKAADDYSGAFNKDVQKNLRNAMSSIPVWDDTGNSPWKKSFQQVRKDLHELGNEKIGITIDESTAIRSIENMRERLKTLEDTAPDTGGFHNARDARRQLDEALGTVDDAKRRGADQGAAYAGAFDTQLRDTLDKSSSAIRPLKVTTDTTQADRDIAALKTRLETLSGKTIGVDISSTEAMVEIKAIEKELNALDRDDVDIQVRVDSRTAAAELRRLREEADGGAAGIANMGNATNLTMTRMTYLILLASSLGSVLVPAAAAAAGAIGFIGTSAASAVAGVGVLALGLSGLGGAITALNKYQQDQNKSANSVNQANRSLTGSTDAVRQAELSLANTRRTVADQQVDAEGKVRKAVADVAQARHDSGIAARDSARQVADAQRDLTRSELDAKDARTALNVAIKTAIDNEHDLSTALDRNQVDQQKAITAQLKALNELHALQANPRASEVELRTAKDNYDEQTVRLEELRNKRVNLNAEQEKSAKLGIEADTKVIAARKAVAAADQKVADQRVKLAREQQDAAERTYQSNKKVADAQAQVTAAERDQARQRQQGQYQIATAMNAVATAARTQQQATEKMGLAGGEALNNLKTAMAQLSPTQQTFARFIFGLKDEFLQLRAAAADPMLPGFQQAIQMLLPYLPGVATFIGKIAAELGSLAVRAAAALQGPVWQRFFSFIDDQAVPTMETWAKITGNTVDGLLSLYLALTPFDGQVGKGLVGLSEDFAKWADQLGKSKGYKEFLEYVRANGPEVVDFLGSLGKLAFHLLEAMAPVGAVAMKMLDGIADGLNAIPIPILTILVATIAALSLGMLGLGLKIKAARFKEQLGGIFGPAQERYVARYGEATGRATEQMGRFRTAVATTSGAALTARDRVTNLGTSIKTTFGNANSGMIGRLAHQSGLLREEGGRLNTAFAAMGGSAVVAAKKVGTLSRGFGSIVSSAGGLVGFLGGPWGVALTAATLLLIDFGAKSAAQKSKVDGLASALGSLNDEFVDLRDQGKLGSNAASEAFRQIVKSNPDLQKAVIQLDKLGVSFDDMLNSVTSGNPTDVLKAFDDEIHRLVKENIDARSKWGDFGFLIQGPHRDQISNLSAMRDAWVKHTKEVAQSTAALKIFDEQSARHIAMGNIVKNNTGANAKQLAGLATQWDLNQDKLAALDATMANFGNTSTAAAARADDLTAAIERQYGAAIKANEAGETWSGTLLSLKESAESNGRTLDINSRAGLSNRDALEAAAQASRQMFLEEVRAGGKLPEVTKKHEARIAALVIEAKKSFGAKSEAADLIKMYGKIDPSITTKYNTENFDKVFMQAQELRFAQYLLEQGITDPSQAKKLWKQTVQTNQTTVNMGGSAIAPWAVQGKATGGPIVGAGTATSDDVPIWASDGEHMITAAEVDAAGGHDAIYAFRRALMDGVHKHAAGGPVVGPGQPGAGRYGWPQYSKGGAVAPFPVQLSMTKLPSMAEAEDAVRNGGGSGVLGGSEGGRGWRWQFATLKKMFPNISLYSGYRENSYTDSGGLSWHSRDGGRAVDVTPLQKIFDYIHNTFGKLTQELIWGGDPSRNIYHGEHHRFSDSLLRQHGPFKGKDGPSPHIHWAYDQGGWLQPGPQNVVNMTGKPEPVLTQPQWAAVEDQNSVMQKLVADANGIGHGGNTYQFAFRDTTLDAAKLRSMQQRDEALQRVGRPR